MPKAEREAEGARIWALASALEDDDRQEAAVELYRVAARLGNKNAWVSLGNLLGTLAMPGASAEAIYWLRRYLRISPSQAAWNLAMYHRQRGRRASYFHWLKRAAEEGDEDAVEALSDPERLKHAWWALEGIDPPPMAQLRAL
jgi:TPR repeat protein